MWFSTDSSETDTSDKKVDTTCSIRSHVSSREKSGKEKDDFILRQLNLAPVCIKNSGQSHTLYWAWVHMQRRDSYTTEHFTILEP